MRGKKIRKHILLYDWILQPCMLILLSIISNARVRPHLGFIMDLLNLRCLHNIQEI